MKKPLLNSKEINRRYDFIEEMLTDINNIQEIEKLLNIHDLQRIYIENDIKLTNGKRSDFYFHNEDLINYLEIYNYPVDSSLFQYVLKIPNKDADKFRNYKFLINELKLTKNLFTLDETKFLIGKLNTEINFDTVVRCVLVMAWLIRQCSQEFYLFFSLVLNLLYLNLPRICLVAHEHSLGNSKVVSML